MYIGVLPSTFSVLRTAPQVDIHTNSQGSLIFIQAGLTKKSPAALRTGKAQQGRGNAKDLHGALFSYERTPAFVLCTAQKHTVASV